MNWLIILGAYVLICGVIEYSRYIMHPSHEYNLAGKLLLFPVSIFWFFHDHVMELVIQ